MTKPKRPRDPFQLAKLIGDISTGQAADPSESAKARGGRAGGLKGGKARMAATGEIRDEHGSIKKGPERSSVPAPMTWW
jgi:hypothetical protein